MTEIIEQLKEDFSKNLILKSLKEFRKLADEAGLERSCFIEVDKPRFSVKHMRFVADVYAIVWHNEISRYTIDAGTDIPLLIETLEKRAFAAHMSCSVEVDNDYDEACKEEHAWLWETERGLAAKAVA